MSEVVFIPDETSCSSLLSKFTHLLLDNVNQPIRKPNLYLGYASEGRDQPNWFDNNLFTRQSKYVCIDAQAGGRVAEIAGMVNQRGDNITARRMISGLVLKYLNGEFFVICGCYKYTLLGSTEFNRTVALAAIGRMGSQLSLAASCTNVRLEKKQQWS